VGHLAPLVALQLALGVVIAAMTLREFHYLRELWQESQTNAHPERSWLLGALVRITATILLGCTYFLATLLIRLVWGVQSWTAPVSAGVIIALLLVPRQIGQTMRRRERAARTVALQAELDEQHAERDARHERDSTPLT
jgi:small-conductance mechanosensitive channel